MSHKEQIVVASTNPVKINSAKQGFEAAMPDTVFTVTGVKIKSGVSDQPMTSDETFTEAINRAQTAKVEQPNADYWIGLEGGVEDVEGEMRSVVWVVILSLQQIGKARASSFILPQKMADMIRSGMEMGDADDAIFGLTNSKQQMGAVGLMTKGAVDRTSLYREAVILALMPFLNPELFPESFKSNN